MPLAWRFIPHSRDDVAALLGKIVHTRDFEQILPDPAVRIFVGVAFLPVVRRVNHRLRSPCQPGPHESLTLERPPTKIQTLCRW